MDEEINGLRQANNELIGTVQEQERYIMKLEKEVDSKGEKLENQSNDLRMSQEERDTVNNAIREYSSPRFQQDTARSNESQVS